MISVETNYPVAVDSNDHLKPMGTKKDNSFQYRFYQKIYELLKINNLENFCDLGCAGGKFVKKLNDSGFKAVGIEGSDYSKNSNRSSWGNLKDTRLFTADITKDFKIKDDQKLMNFDIISAFEVLEHIKEKDLKNLFYNIKKHSKKNTIYIFSIGTSIDYYKIYHQNVQDEKWWINYFDTIDLYKNLELMNYFNKNYLRGPYEGDADSFNIVLTNKDFNINEIKIPKLSISTKILDFYSISPFRKKIKKFLNHIKYGAYIYDDSE